MAQYKAPPDPRKSDEGMRDKRPFPTSNDPIPWRWLGGGVLITLVGLSASLFILRAFLLRDPLPVGPVEPTVIVLTAPPRLTPSPETAVTRPTAAPTFTPVPTPDVAVAPDTITPGYYAQVVNTDNIGVTVRGGPSTNNAPLTVAPENATLLVLDGPTEGNDFLWWQVRLEDGTEGWVAGSFLLPIAAP